MTHVGTCVLACLLVLLNGAVTFALYEYMRPSAPKFLAQPKVAQSLMFVGPILLTFLEWWTFDLVFSRRRARSGSERARG